MGSGESFELTPWRPDLNPGLQGVSSQLSPLPTVRQSTLHCTTVGMTLHNKTIINREDIHDIKRYVCISIISLMVISWRLTKNDSVTPYILIWQRQQCYHLCFFSWRPIKNNSVTPYVFFHDDQEKTTVLPLMFSFMTTKKKQQCYPLCFFSWRPKKNNSVTPYIFFRDDQ